MRSLIGYGKKDHDHFFLYVKLNTMGWNAKCIFIRKQRDELFVTGTSQDSMEARKILQWLNYNSTSSIVSNFEVGICPKRGWVCVGANNVGCILSNFPEIEVIAGKESNAFVERCHQIFPKAEMLVFELASATNYFAYELYQDTVLVRKVAGDAERGIFVSEGDAQPEEINAFQEAGVYNNSANPSQKRCELGNSLASSEIGEPIVFAIAGRFLGVPLDQCELESFQVELFEKHKILWPFTLLKRK